MVNRTEEAQNEAKGALRTVGCLGSLVQRRSTIGMYLPRLPCLDISCSNHIRVLGASMAVYLLVIQKIAFSLFMSPRLMSQAFYVHSAVMYYERDARSFVNFAVLYYTMRYCVFFTCVLFSEKFVMTTPQYH